MIVLKLFASSNLIAGGYSSMSEKVVRISQQTKFCLISAILKCIVGIKFKRIVLHDIFHRVWKSNLCPQRY